MTETMIDSVFFVQRVPKSFFDMVKLPTSEKDKWYAAIDEEYSSLKRLNTFEVIETASVPPGAQILDTTYVFTIKTDPARHKARLCDQETAEQTLAEIFSTVARSENFKLLLTLVASLGWTYYICDVKNAFVNAKLTKPAYIKIPFGVPGDRRTHVWKLNKALYGLRRSPAEWNRELTKTLLSMGFRKTVSDWNFFVKDIGKDKILLAFHVDDGLITCNNQAVLDEVMKDLSAKYELKVNRNPDSFLGISINRNVAEKLIYLNQSHYIDQCVAKFDCPDKSSSVPMDPGFQPLITDADTKLEAQYPYRSIIGALLHIARMTRPDILYAVSILSKSLSNPQKRHWEAAKRVLAYLRDSKHESLALGALRKDNSFLLHGYADSTWGDDLENRRSRSGGVLFFNGSLISAWSKQQPTPALSSTESEYQAMCLATQEVMYFRQLLKEIGYFQLVPTIIFGDNKGALDLSVSTKQHNRVKHIDIKFHFIRDQVEMKTIELEYVPTTEQIADIFTKPLAKGPFHKLKQHLHVQLWGGVTTTQSSV